MLMEDKEEMSQADEKRTWYVLDADCGVYNELLEVLGIKGLELVDLPKLKLRLLKELLPIHGIIFLYKRFYSDEELGPVLHPTQSKGIFYTKQLVYNANVIHAIVSVALNCSCKSVSLGSLLDSYKSSFIRSNAYSRGLALKNNEILRQVHNYFALKTLPTQLEEIPKDNNRYHYTALVPIAGKLYEIDGLKEGPVDLGVIDDEYDWLKFVRRVIKRRIIVYQKKQINFKVMAVTSFKNKHLNGEAIDQEEKLQSWTLLTDFKRRRMSVKRRRKMKDAKKVHEDTWSQFIAKWSDIYAESVVLRNEIDVKLKEMENRLQNDVGGRILRDRKTKRSYPRYLSEFSDLDLCGQSMFSYKSQRRKLKLVLTKDEHLYP